MISIIVPYYNIKEEYIRKCLDSFEIQTYKNIEVIIVDDGSKVPLSNMINTNKYSFPLIIKRIDNQGVSVARNIGIEKAKGDYLMFVDADDMLCETACELLHNAILDSDADVVVSKNFTTKTSGIESLKNKKCIELERDDVIRQIISHEKRINDCELGSPWAKIFRKKYIIEKNIKYVKGLKKSQDRVFLLYAIKEAERVYFLDSYTYIYRCDNETSICNRYNSEIDKILNNALDEITRFSENYDSKMDYEIKKMKLNFIFVTMKLKFFNIDNPDNFKTRKEQFILYCKQNNLDYLLKDINKYKLITTHRIVFKLIQYRQYWLLNIIFSLVITLQRKSS